MFEKYFFLISGVEAVGKLTECGFDAYRQVCTEEDMSKVNT